MKLKENLKRFWTLDVHNHEGFTLVELIIVIAILAILSTGAIAGYSAYVERANKAADQAMISEIKNALTLYYYSNPNEVVGGYVILNVDENAEFESEFVNNAMKATYGDNWQAALKLKYSDWSATFQGSNFYGDANGLQGLLGTVEDLTGALGLFLERSDIDEILGANGAFNSYMEGMNAGTAAEKADAAVFYVADITAGLDATALNNAANAVMQYSSQGPETVMGAMNTHTGSTIASAAALYAMAEGFATFFEKGNYEVPEGQKSPRTILNEANATLQQESGTYSETVSAFSVLMTAFQKMGGVNTDATTAYMNATSGTSPLHQDMNAYADAMKTVSSAKGSIMENNDKVLGSDDYFNNAYISSILATYAEGGIFVYVAERNGDIVVSSSIDK